MEVPIMGIIMKVKNMEEEFINGQMVVNMMVSGLKTKLMVMEFIVGQMVVNIKVLGQIIIWMDMVFTHGLMVENMLVNIRMIKNMGSDDILGQMDVSTKGTGQKESNMVLDNIQMLVKNLEQVFGKMANELNGLMQLKFVRSKTMKLILRLIFKIKKAGILQSNKILYLESQQIFGKT